VQHGIELPVAVVELARPRIGAVRFWVAGKVEDVNHTLPHELTSVPIIDWNRLDKRRRTAVLGFDGALEFVRADLIHWAWLKVSKRFRFGQTI
jgi:hypothetical protein